MWLVAVRTFGDGGSIPRKALAFAEKLAMTASSFIAVFVACVDDEVVEAFAVGARQGRHLALVFIQSGLRMGMALTTDATLTIERAQGVFVWGRVFLLHLVVMTLCIAMTRFARNAVLGCFALVKSMTATTLYRRLALKWRNDSMSVSQRLRQCFAIRIKLKRHESLVVGNVCAERL